LQLPTGDSPTSVSLFSRIDKMQNSSLTAATKMGNKKRKYSNNSAASDTDSAIEADISLVRDEVCLSPDLGQVEEPKKTKTTPKLKQMSVQSFFGKSKPPALKLPPDEKPGKSKSPAPKQPTVDSDSVVLEVKDKSSSDSAIKQEKCLSPAPKKAPGKQCKSGKRKSPIPKQLPGDNEVVVLDVKDKSICDTSNKEEEEITVITVKKQVADEKPKNKEDSADTSVLDTSAEKKQKGLRYDRMVNQALKHLNTQGEGCSKLEILVFILRKFKPAEDIVAINEKLGKALEFRVKKGTLLSNEKAPKESLKPKEKFQKAVAINKKWIKKERASPKTAKKKEPEKQKQKTPTKPKVAEMQKPLILNPTLAIICEAKKLTKQEVGKKVWTYIKKHNLRDPKNKLMIRCDQNLKKLTKRKTIPSSSLMAHIKQSFIPV